MKKKLMTISALLLCSLLSVTTVEAQPRGGNPNRNETHSTSRPGRGGSGNSNFRPGNNNNRPQQPANNSFRPGNNNNRPQQPANNNFRPGNNNNRPQQPANNSFRPGNNNNKRPQQPANNIRPGQNNPSRPNVVTRPALQRPNVASRPAPGRPAPGISSGYRPGPNRPAYMRPTVHAGRPISIPWTRPVPPAHWRPTYAGSLIGNILGLAFGVAMNTALDNLYYSGYNIDGYMNNQVYLQGVSQFNVYWPDATLYFGTGGGLVRSQFYDPSVGYNSDRFYSVYSTLCGLYGVPAINNTTGLTLNATWFGRGGDYITLQYQPMNSGNYNYFTILTIGR